jgi:exopolysaccharide biosynthesis polyprenyl glycosylphosphotransferase
MNKKLQILNVRVSAINMEKALRTMGEWIDQGQRQYVTVTPAHAIMDCYRHPELRPIFNASGMTTPDGMAVVWLLRLMGEKQVSRVYGPDLALPAGEHEQVRRLVDRLQDLPVHIWVIPDQISLALHTARVEEFGGTLMFDLRAPALDDYQRLTKRMFDIVMTLLVMPLALPAMGIAALLVRLDSPGPVLYRAKRVGENGRIFTMYKFRTMVTGADRMLDLSPDENGQANHKRPDDPRVTRVGRFLRKTSLDELPQLFNVLRGDMSLVGPRPELPELVERYLAWQRERFAVPQGLTGWWQVNGRSDKPMHLHTEEDLFYVRNYSIWLDLKILIKTAWVVLKGKGAF